MHSDKQRIKVIISLVLAALVIGEIGYRLFWLNARYPSPQIRTYGLHESVQAGGYAITLSDWQWKSSSAQERTGVAELTVAKTTAEASVLDLTNISFESGAWGGQFDAQLMFELNPELESLLLQMNAGESKSIRFPITVIDRQFTSEQWSGIDERPFCIVLQYYPEKLQFECPVFESAGRVFKSHQQLHKSGETKLYNPSATKGVTQRHGTFTMVFADIKRREPSREPLQTS